MPCHASACSRTHLCAQAHTPVHAHTALHSCTCAHTCIFLGMHCCMHKLAHLCMPTCTHVHKFTHLHTHTSLHRVTPVHTLGMLTHTCAQSHTCPPVLPLPFPLPFAQCLSVGSSALIHFPNSSFYSSGQASRLPARTACLATCCYSDSLFLFSFRSGCQGRCGRHGNSSDLSMEVTEGKSFKEQAEAFGCIARSGARESPAWVCPASGSRARA